MNFMGMGSRSEKPEKPAPDCFCITCSKWVHHLGIMSHRAAHRRRDERCKIQYSDGRVIDHRFDLSI